MLDSVNPHHDHLTSEELCDLALSAQQAPLECAQCDAALGELLQTTGAVKRLGDEGLLKEDLTDWDATLLRQNIRRAIDKEPAHALRFWEKPFRLWLQNPLVAGAALAGLVLVVLSAPISSWRNDATGTDETKLAHALPPWSALPSIDDDESFAILEAAGPTAEEIEVGSCGSGLCHPDVELMERAEEIQKAAPMKDRT